MEISTLTIKAAKMDRGFAIVGVVTTLVLLSATAFAQIPNAGFENWTNDTITGWWSNNVAPLYATISKTTTAHGGSYGVRGDVVQFYTQTVQPALQSGANARGFAYAQRPSSFTGYYQFSPAASSGDRFAVNVVLYNGGVTGTQVGVAAAALPTFISSYTQFTATFNYLNSDVPDTCIIQFQIVGADTGAQAAPHIGSYFLLDDIAFTGATGVAERTSAPKIFQLNQNYPNPFNPTTNISFSAPIDGKATLRIFNVLGQEVASIFDSRIQAGKLYRATFSGSYLPSGVYFARLDYGDKQLLRKMTLIK